MTLCYKYIILKQNSYIQIYVEVPVIYLKTYSCYFLTTKFLSTIGYKNY